MYAPDESPIVAVVHPSEELVDLVQYELDQLGLSTVAIVPDPPDDPDTILSYLPSPPSVCVFGVASPRRSGLSCLVCLRRALPATRFAVIAPVPSRVDVWQGGALADVILESEDIETTAGRVVASVRRILFIPPAPIVQFPAGARHTATVLCTVAETVAAARATREVSRALRERAERRRI